MLREAERKYVRILFRNSHAIAKHNMPLTDYNWMADLDKAKGLDIGRTYLK